MTHNLTRNSTLNADKNYVHNSLDGMPATTGQVMRDVLRQFHRLVAVSPKKHAMLSK